MFKFTKPDRDTGVMRLQLEAPPLPRRWAEGPEVLPAQPQTDPVTGSGTAGISKSWIAVGLLGLAIGAFCLRFLPNNDHSAYMDEVSQILAGRYLLEQHSVYAYILQWSYGSYLWPVVAGGMDIVGGLTMVRAFTALCGAIMTLATAGVAYRLTSRALPERQRWFVGFGAGLLMAILPTGIGLGNFGTYDALAGAAFMSGIALLFPVEGRGRRSRLVAGSALLFIAFLSKYVIAAYFPFICLYLIFSAGSVKNAISRIGWFVGPLTLACAAYFAIFRSDLLTLLSFSHTYSDLKTDDPFLVYVWERPEIWLLAAIASFGWGYANRQLKIVSLGGAAIILVFQLIARPDYDFWKHSIYLVFFLSPLAALALVTMLTRLFTKTASNPALSPARKRLRLTGFSVVSLVVLGILLSTSLTQANILVNFYPNLNPALPAIEQNVTGAKEVLTDDLALRYYLYPHIPTEEVTDPFFINYQGKTGLDAYKASVEDRYYDLIILDGGIGPVAQKVNAALQPLVQHYYNPVASVDVPNGKVTIYKRQQCVVSEPTPGATLFNFSGGIQGWGGRPVKGDFQPGNLVSVSQEQSCDGQPSLKFTPSAAVPQVGITLKQPVKTVKAQVYIQTGTDFTGDSVIGMAAFDQNWQWHDDGFKQRVPTGRWVEISWQLPANPGNYRELDLVFPKEATTVYISHVELES
ncbi:MAG: hypothetical protein J0I20_18135 [Chloroflexi bacterium]|mgnify:CR=1 FL=1|nr:hypothetical protein [Chloroflexota bacterium]OJV86842.1 MAG: hypothetical protein BGO39_13525 [Chloroflexi bacterium 54-19]